MGIKDEYHQNAILISVEELLQQGSLYGVDKLPLQSQRQGSGVSGSVGGPIIGNEHNFIEYNFSSLKQCDKCLKHLRGLQRQGLVCQDCNIKVHRICSVTGGLKGCQFSTIINNNRNNTLRSGTTQQQHQQQSHHQKTMINYFGLSLCLQYNKNELPAPLVIIKCCKELERQAILNHNLDLYRLYRSSIPINNDDIIKLRDKLNSDIYNINLSEYSPQLIGEIIKKFLRELPDPVIPVGVYERFLEASSKL